MRIPKNIAKQTSRVVYDKLVDMTDDQKRSFMEEFYRKKKQVRFGYIFWFLFGLHYAYIGRWGMQVIFWITAGGLGIWWLIDAFRMTGIIRDHNTDMSTKIMKDMVAIV